MTAWLATSATTASNGSRKARRTTAGRRPRRRSPQDLSEDLRDAWERLRETAVEFGDQRIYASHKSIMFSRKSCYFFVRPKKELPRGLRVPRPRAEGAAGPARRSRSKSKFAHILRIPHRDEVEAPITDWLREAYELSEVLAQSRPKPPARKTIAEAEGIKQQLASARRSQAGKCTPKRRTTGDHRSPNEQAPLTRMGPLLLPEHHDWIDGAGPPRRQE